MSTHLGVCTKVIYTWTDAVIALIWLQRRSCPTGRSPRPPDKDAVEAWYVEVEEPRGAGLDPSTKQKADYFYGMFACVHSPSIFHDEWTDRQVLVSWKSPAIEITMILSSCVTAVERLHNLSMHQIEPWPITITLTLTHYFWVCCYCWRYSHSRAWWLWWTKVLSVCTSSSSLRISTGWPKK